MHSPRTTAGFATESHIPIMQAGVRCPLSARSANFIRLVQADPRTPAYRAVQRLSLPGQRPGPGSTAPARCGEGE